MYLHLSSLLFAHRVDAKSLQALVGAEALPPPCLCLFVQAVMVVADTKVSLMLSGNGDVLEPHDGIIGKAAPSTARVFHGCLEPRRASQARCRIRG